MRLDGLLKDQFFSQRITVRWCLVVLGSSDFVNDVRGCVSHSIDRVVLVDALSTESLLLLHEKGRGRE